MIGVGSHDIIIQAPSGSTFHVDEARSRFYLAQNSPQGSPATSEYWSKPVTDGVVVTFYPGPPSLNGKPKIDPVIYGDLYLTKE